MKKLVRLAAFGLCVAVRGAVTLFDFETPAEIAAAPKGRNASRSFAVESRFATAGTNALRWTCAPWRQGLEEWPSITMRPPVTDWRGFDRLVVDLVSHGDAGDLFAAYFAEPEGRIQNGLAASLHFAGPGYAQWVIPLKNWPKTANPAHITRVHFFTEHAKSFDVSIDRITLLKPGEPPPLPTSAQVARDILPLVAAEITNTVAKARRALAARAHDESYWRFRLACAEAGQKTAQLSVGLASTMEKVRPRAAFRATPATRARVRLARGEKEGVQVIVAAGDADLKQVGVTCGDLRRADGAVFPARAVHCAVTGYVETKWVPRYKVGFQSPATNAVGYARRTRKPETGWWPDPILDYLAATDVKGRDAQSFWVRVSCPDAQPAGVYAGALVVTVAGTPAHRIPFEIRVNDFAVPKRSPLPLAVSFAPGYSMQFATPEQVAEAKAHRADPNSTLNLWKKHRAAWCDFLADYYITMDSIYHHATYDPATGRTAAEAAFYPDMLLRLKAQGRLDCFNLGYWSRLGKGADALRNWRASHLPRLRSTYDFAKRHGILDRAFIYGCDEAPAAEHAEVQLAVKELKKEFPGVPIFTTAYDHEFGVNTTLACMDWFTPLTPKFDCAKAAKARAEGRQVWWYICCGPHAPHANMFVECPAIEGRLLTGAMTTRMRPDGFLYYAIAIWNARHPITGANAFTDWTARSWTTYHGDGSWTCCGPDGTPLATQRLENFRDGLEDFAYARELERRLKRAPASAAAWRAKAAALLAVPKDVMDTMTNYTDDPAALLRWRDGMADLIESAPAK